MATARAVAAAAAALAAVVLVALLAPAVRGVDRSEFPPGFLFGAATSAYQVSPERPAGGPASLPVLHTAVAAVP
jgi:hypothetical protein